MIYRLSPHFHICDESHYVPQQCFIQESARIDRNIQSWGESSQRTLPNRRNIWRKTSSTKYASWHPSWSWWWLLVDIFSLLWRTPLNGNMEWQMLLWLTKQVHDELASCFKPKSKWHLGSHTCRTRYIRETIKKYYTFYFLFFIYLNVSVCEKVALLSIWWIRENYPKMLDVLESRLIAKYQNSFLIP